MDRLAEPPISMAIIRQAVDWAIETRRSVRAFASRPVPQHEIESILETARFSASGVNMQPWQVHVVTGEARNRLSEIIVKLEDTPSQSQILAEPYDYYPEEWVSPYDDRRKQVGWALYGLLGIQKGDRKRMHEQHSRNYQFFDAPVGLFFTIDRSLGKGSFLDYGMFLQCVMIAARARGLHTCPQASFLKYHAVISKCLDFPQEQILVCGMSLGYAEPGRIENELVTEREPVQAFATFHTS